MRRPLWRLVAPVAAVAAMVLAFRAPLPYFVERPGELFGLSGRVTVEGYDEPLHGEVLFGTVNVRGATLAAAVRAAFDPHAQLVRRERLIPDGMDSTAFFAQQRAEFALAADVAAAVGLRAAGLRVDPDALRGEGALILRVVRGGPAEHRLRPGDVVTAVDGRPLRTEAEYADAVAEAGWQPVTLTVHRGERVAELRLTPVATRQGEPSLGLVVSTFRPQVRLPVEVRVEQGEVAGPSAGLAVALAVYDRAVPDDVLAGRRVVVTGSVDTAGRVGPVGGVGLKAVAADHAGVDLLIVPEAQFDDARSAVGRDSALEIVGAATFQDALAALRADEAAVPAAA